MKPIPMPSYQIHSRFHQVRCLLFLLTLFGVAACAQAEELELHFVGGDVAKVEVANATLNWKTIEKNGTSRASAISFSGITKLLLTNSPEAKKAEAVANALANLGHPSYQVRQQAEEELVEIGNGFRNIIETYRTSEDLEVRIRANRVIDRLEESDKKIRVEYDALTTDAGASFQGDAGEFSLNCQYRGRELVVPRSQLVAIIKPQNRQPIAAGDNAFLPVDFEAFLQPGGKFYTNDQNIVDFSTTASGNELTATNSVQDAYIPLGMKLSTDEENGTVVISSYEFNAFGKLPKKESIAVYTSVKRFRGAINIEFCMPNQPSVPAGVKEFGTYLARIENSRDFIMECYGENSELISSVDCLKDGGCGFMGFRSSVPITRVRLLSNPHLFRIDRTVDDDYGLDHLCFSKPIATRLLPSERPLIRLKNGDTLFGQSLTYDADRLKIESDVFGVLEFPIGEVAEVVFAKPLSSDEKKSWVAVLDDASQVVVSPGETFESETLGLSLESKQLRALYNQQALFRYPFAGDTARSKSLLVFPTCRVGAKSLKFSNRGFSWDQDSEKFLQPVDEEDPLGVDGVDPTPQINQVEYDKSTVEDLPTIWMGDPVAPAPWCGALKTDQGEILVFGEGANFQLDKIDRTSVSLTGMGKTIEIPMDSISSIHWPAE